MKKKYKWRMDLVEVTFYTDGSTKERIVKENLNKEDMKIIESFQKTYN